MDSTPLPTMVLKDYQPIDQLKWGKLINNWFYYVPKLKRGLGFSLPIRHPNITTVPDFRNDIIIKDLFMFEILPYIYHGFSENTDNCKLFVSLYRLDGANLGSGCVKISFDKELPDKKTLDSFCNYIYNNLINELPKDIDESQT